MESRIIQLYFIRFWTTSQAAHYQANRLDPNLNRLDFYRSKPFWGDKKNTIALLRVNLLGKLLGYI